MEDYNSIHTGKEIDDAISRVKATPGSGAISYLDVGAAPAGYGYGDTMTAISGSSFAEFLANLNDRIHSMEHKTSCQIVLDAKAAGLNGYNCGVIGTLYRYDSYSYFYGHIVKDNTEVRFEVHGGEFTGWEYVNPPMQPGVEYRTTERYDGKPVYVQLLLLGTLPNSALAVIPHNIADVGYVLEVEAHSPSEGMTVTDYQEITGFWANRTNVYVRTASDLSSMPCRVIMKYFKTTD